MAPSSKGALTSPSSDTVPEPAWVVRLARRPEDIKKVVAIFQMMDSCDLRMLVGNDNLGHVLTGCPVFCLNLRMLECGKLCLYYEAHLLCMPLTASTAGSCNPLGFRMYLFECFFGGHPLFTSLG